MYKPKTTYRIQFNRDFNFKALDRIIPYLNKLGIDTIYASPIFEAVPGSTHGYDTINPHRINPEIGTETELLALSKKLKTLGIGWLQDVVPNHMAFHPSNRWLMDVLEKGNASEFAEVFDVDFKKSNPLMVPFLGESLTDAIQNRSLKLVQVKKKFYLRYGAADWPVRTDSIRSLTATSLAKINRDPIALQKIAGQQHYRLCDWKETNSTINYRRFFTVNSLICLNIQRLPVFNLYHQYLFELMDQGIFQGLRIDHVDGLFNPETYIGRLREKVGSEVYLVVEKILATNEELPSGWQAEGNTGYDFLAMSNNLLSNRRAIKPFSKLYADFTQKTLKPEELAIQKKRAILSDSMQGELHNLHELFIKAKLLNKEELKTVSSAQIKEALGEWMIHMPVYRFYGAAFPLAPDEAGQLMQIFKLLAQDQKIRAAVLLLIQVLLEKPLLGDPDYNKRLATFYQRCMQFTGPLMAKGIEDTLMFTYNRFVGHTEVGDSPLNFGMSAKDFHRHMTHRQENWPLSMNTSSTHDTKKGEDVRARLNVLTDLPEAFRGFIKDISETVAGFQSQNPLFESLHPNDLFLIYQMVLGILPMPGESGEDLEHRISAFVEKALREAKKRSGWAEPDEDYEHQLSEFAQLLLNARNPAARKLMQFQESIADFGILNSLVQVVLKFSCPGIPDLYQGTELWDLSMVDPDNRRPVDYSARKDALKSLDTSVTLQNLWLDRSNGNLKMWLTREMIRVRSQFHLIFEEGSYIPLKVKGKYKKHIIAFARKKEEEWMVVVLPLGLASWSPVAFETPDALDWKNTRIILPKEAPVYWTDLLHKKTSSADALESAVCISSLFKEIPIAVLHLKAGLPERSSGILMHITSLPSAFGIGDMGQEAYTFVDFLQAAKQRFWQILPLNPTQSGNGHSPYSSNSAFAGNVLLISPQLLAEAGFLSENDLHAWTNNASKPIDFEQVLRSKEDLLTKAYQNFTQNNSHQPDFNQFCTLEDHWLHDFALYTILKQKHPGKAWHEWPEPFKKRDPHALKRFAIEQQKAIAECKWRQYVFFTQWRLLKQYANLKYVQIIGDLPFYVDYDSADVWSNPDQFMLDKNHQILQMAGVPPDYFNELGQLWGMPVFNWAKMKENQYAWWIRRLAKNVDCFDLVRLDHFRAFSAYWSVGAEQQNAVHGEWIEGPGVDFFKTVQKHLGKLPFIAEDLGDISPEVEELRDNFDLPGMKVIQFAFGPDLLTSVHIPHRYARLNDFAYSGTHDNNTLKGWFKEELDSKGKRRLEAYVGKTSKAGKVNKVLIRLLYASNARVVMIPMQDVLGLGSGSRMNLPGSVQGNWTWRMPRKKWSRKILHWLKFNAIQYGRTH